MQTVTVANLPSAAVWIIALSQLILAIGVLTILALTATHMITILKEISATVKEVRGTMEDLRRDLVPDLRAKLKNTNLPH